MREYTYGFLSVDLVKVNIPYAALLLDLVFHLLAQGLIKYKDGTVYPCPCRLGQNEIKLRGHWPLRSQSYALRETK
jgi:hypothetical protein